ncbi:hypothetical protein EKO04_006260 [Ascochyta lentis]|uniref:Retrovirus-related Pol polyprotein from transposon TNT 1-94-like beta-barrel domain-containing protein n=1 Tax=Ascochyta lentis TaxID=205686 RepID=A0A8H7J0Y6_9PLEO|nr:hypothetical protein EKO04_006260 [Ascochyta lentis]
MYSPLASERPADIYSRLEHGLKETMETETLNLGREMELKTVVGLALVDDEYNSLMHEWIMDSGASMHLCNNKKWFTEFADLPTKTVQVANTKANLDITGGGTVTLDVQTKEGKWNQVTLSNVLYAPDAMCNLLSISQLTNKGATGYVNETTFDIIHNDELLMDATSYEGLFKLNMYTSQPYAFAGTSPTAENNDEPEQPNATETNDEPEQPNTTENNDEPEPQTEEPGFNFNDRVWALHRDLGHMSLEAMSRLADMLEGMPVSKKEIKARMGQSCPVCKVTTDVVRVPRDPASRTS